MPRLVRLDRPQVQFNKAVMWIHFILGVSHEMMKRISLRLGRDKSPSLQVVFLKGKAVLARLLIQDEQPAGHMINLLGEFGAAGNDLLRLRLAHPLAGVDTQGTNTLHWDEPPFGPRIAPLQVGFTLCLTRKGDFP